MPTPEELARQNIDALLEKCSWKLQTRATINLDGAQGVAIREGLLKGGDEADYLLLPTKSYRDGGSEAGRFHPDRR